MNHSLTFGKRTKLLQSDDGNIIISRSIASEFLLRANGGIVLCEPSDVIRFAGYMFTKRVIPCLDVHDGKVTRGVQFGRAEEGGLRNVGDPVELAVRYNEQGADEMVFFDITASAHGRATMVDVIERTAARCFMPLTVGGGIRTVDDMSAMLKAGADKISINSSALATPDLITAGAERFGSQC